MSKGSGGAGRSGRVDTGPRGVSSRRELSYGAKQAIREFEKGNTTSYRQATRNKLEAERIRLTKAKERFDSESKRERATRWMDDPGVRLREVKAQINAMRREDYARRGRDYMSNKPPEEAR